MYACLPARIFPLAVQQPHVPCIRFSARFVALLYSIVPLVSYMCSCMMQSALAARLAKHTGA